MTVLSPALELAIQLFAEGRTIPAHLCAATPVDVHDIRRVRLGFGRVGADGGTLQIDKEGVATCIAYDVQGQLVTSVTPAMPIRVHPGQQAKVRALTLQ